MNDKLDHTLKDWASRHELSSDEQQQLARKITTEAARQRYQQTYSAHVPLHAKFRYATAGAFLMLAILILGFWIIRPESGSPGSVGSDNPLRLAVIPEARIDAGKQLFSEMDRLFGDKLRWVAESNGDASIGVDPIAGGVSQDAVPLMVRLTVVSRADGAKEWKTAWTTDLLVRGEERVEIAPNSKTDNRLALWVYPMRDGKLAVDTDVSLDLAVRLAGQTSTIAQQNRPQEILRLCEGNVEYRVLQTVKRLNGKGEVNDA